VHDYTKRQHYAAIEKFLKLERIVDSMAVFEVLDDAAARCTARSTYDMYKFDAR
jgi:hypothetical protein